MIFRQLFEPIACAYTYLIACEKTGEAALIDPVLETAERDLALIKGLRLQLKYSIETHLHADHVTGAASLRDRTGCRAAFPEQSGVDTADVQVREGEPISVGTLRLEPMHVPGHTNDHHAYILRTEDGVRIFTGDALMIDGCGRTDFQNGDAGTLYRSVHDKIFTLPDETLVYPGHDYQQRQVTSVGQEKARNPRLGGGKTLQEFVAIMAALDLPRPKKMDVAVPANRQCGAAQPA